MSSVFSGFSLSFADILLDDTIHTSPKIPLAPAAFKFGQDKQEAKGSTFVARSRRKSSNRGPRESVKSIDEPRQDGEGWISVVPKHHRKSMNHEEASQHRKKFHDSHKQGRSSFSNLGPTFKTGGGPSARERKKSTAEQHAKEPAKKSRAKSEAVVKDKEAFRALSKLNPEWANESAIADSEGDSTYAMDAAKATEQFEAWKAQMKAVAFEEPDQRFELPPPPPPEPLLSLLQPALAIPQSNRFRRGSNHEDLIWGTSSSPQETLMLHRRADSQSSKFQDIFNNPSSPKSTGSLSNTNTIVTNTNLSTASLSAPINVPIAKPSQHSPANSYLGAGTPPQPLYYSSPLGNNISFNIAGSQQPRTNTELPYGQAPKFQSEYLKQITTFHTQPQ